MNEAWILERFLSCASLWADIIFVADQGSDDGTRTIIEKFPKARLVENPSPTFDEDSRQKLLLRAARTIDTPRLLIALDADEMFSGNVLTHPEWQRALRATPGTVIAFSRAAISPDFGLYWWEGGRRNSFPLGFVDDGTAHVGVTIHGTRIPNPPHARRLELRSICVLHYQYTDWARMKSKHRWYQCWERLNDPQRSAVDIYRQYHHMHAVHHRHLRRIPADWFKAYEERGIDMTSIQVDSVYRWDLQVLELLIKHGAAYFRRLAIWEINWGAVAEQVGRAVDPSALAPRRTLVDRVGARWLAATQPYAAALPVRYGDSMLRRIWR